MKRTTMLFKAIFPPEFEAKFRRRLVEQNNREVLKIIQKNKRFENIYSGKRCFIIGNGPSIKKVDFSLLKDEMVFTVNQSPRMNNFRELNTNFHIWTDNRFFHLNKDDPSDMELLDVMKAVNTDKNKPIVFYKTSAKQMIEEYDLQSTLNIEYFCDGYINNELSDVDFPIDRILPIYPTCIHYAILIAIYMGFSEIYLLGCDCTGIVNTINSRVAVDNEYEYGYAISENEKERMKKISKQSSIANEFEWYAALFRIYGYLYDYGIRHGCHIYNATEGSLIENIPKVNLKDVIS